MGNIKPLIWLIGKNGMLGRELSLLLESSGLPYIGTGREVNITDMEALFSFADAHRKSIRWIINCAAYTGVDKAENDTENCRRLNTEAAGNVACVANKTGASLVHISTDYVFNGRGNRPYTEEDATDPVNFYGLTKRDGEEMVLIENKNTYILRTSWLYGSYGKNFVLSMINLMREQETIRVVNDQWGSPTWTRDLAEAIITFLKTADAGKPAPLGIYHFSSEGEICWFDFAKEILNQGQALGILKKNCELVPCTSIEFTSIAKRPPYSVLDKSKMRAVLNVNIPLWNKSLNYFLSEKVYA